MEPILTSKFLKKYNKILAPFGFNGLGYVVYKRTYSRLKENGTSETWTETIERCINGAQAIGAEYTKEEAERLFNYVFNFKCNFAGRMLWQLGTPSIERFGGNSLLNCWFTQINKPEKFCFLFENLMLGGGVGFSIRREDIHELPKIKTGVVITHENTKDADFIVPDSREGWVTLLRKILRSFFDTSKSFNYSTMLVRGYGEVIKGFGGVASGPGILIDGIDNICKIFQSREGKKLRSIDVLDICNLIGSIVVSGNIRRSAQIALGDPDDYLFIRAKRWDLGDIPNWRTLSNNTIYADDYNHIGNSIWEGYLGNGEPYGLFNIKLSQKMGRLGEPQKDNCEGMNPCGEITLSDMECCVSYDTPIITKNGLEIIGTASEKKKKVEIWNGTKWSKVTPHKTKSNQKLYRVWFNDGSYLDCTDYHKFSVADRFSKQYKEVETKNLLQFSKYKIHTEPFQIKYKEGIKHPFDAYTLGFAVGDGHTEGNKTIITLYGDKDFKCPIKGKRNKTQQYARYNVQHQDVNVTENANPVFVNLLKNDHNALNSLFSWNKKSILSFVAGVADADGSNCFNGFRIYISDFERASKIQLLLTKCGIRSSVNLFQPKGTKTNLAIRTKDLYYVQIQDTSEIPVHRLQKTKAKAKYKGKWQCVDRIEKLSGLHDVYCFNEPEKHMGVFNNTLTYQCNLSELYLNNIETKEELIDCAKLLYKTQKAVCALNFIHEETNKIVHKNMRIGVGCTGICQSEDKIDWLNSTYKELKKFDKDWSKKKGWNESIKLTTIKPSGTLSLLGGSTPGIHPAFSQYYIRRVRMSATDRIVEVCKNAGYKTEFEVKLDGTINHRTIIVEFPCTAGENVIIAKDMTAIRQLELVKKLQTVWSDNSISVTVYYHKEELNDIKKWLEENYKNNVKSVSFLLHSEHGFGQAPYEEITKEAYDEAVKNLKSIHEINIQGEDLEVEECDKTSCPIK